MRLASTAALLLKKLWMNLSAQHWAGLCLVALRHIPWSLAQHFWTRRLNRSFAGAFAAMSVLFSVSMICCGGPSAGRAEQPPAGGRPLSELIRDPALIVAILAGITSYSVMALLMNVTTLAMDRYGLNSRCRDRDSMACGHDVWTGLCDRLSDDSFRHTKIIPARTLLCLLVAHSDRLGVWSFCRRADVTGFGLELFSSVRPVRSVNVWRPLNAQEAKP